MHKLRVLFFVCVIQYYMCVYITLHMAANTLSDQIVI